MKKIVILILISLLLLSTLNSASSEQITSSKCLIFNSSTNYEIENPNQEINIQNNNEDLKQIKSRSLTNSPWPMFRQNLNHTGLSPYNTSSNTGTLAWKFMASNRIAASPTIDSNGTIYVGSQDYNLYAIYPNGTKKWSFLTGNHVYSSPAISSNGTIYFTSSDNYLYALYPNGTRKWDFQTGDIMHSSPAIDSNGTIYFGSYDNNLYAVYPNGTKKWNFTTGFHIYSSPAIGLDGAIYIGSRDYNLYAINPNGTMKWSYKTGDEINSSPAIDSNGTIYVGSDDFKLYAIYPNGTKKWSYSTQAQVYSSPAIGPDGIIYVGSQDYCLHAIFPNGTRKWRYNTGGWVQSSPAIGSEGTIYFGSYDHYIYALNPDGTRKWRYLTADGIWSSPAIGSNEMVYIGSYDKALYSIGSLIKLSNCFVNPVYGYSNTYFNFTVNYLHKFNYPPTYVKVEVDGTNFDLIETDSSNTNYLDGKDYYINITHLSIGLQNYKFLASDGVKSISTSIFDNPTVYNTNPNIITQDNLTAIEDAYYEIIYQYEDIDRENVVQVGTWDFYSNATWLSFNPTSVMLYGTPTNDDVGSYWVNISINDSIDTDFNNFTLTVINENNDPMITTVDIEITYEDELYEVDYNASDVDSLISNQIWSLDTNANLWLDINSNSGTISGTPTNDEVGEYWVNVSVDDGDSGLAFSNYTLIVLNVNDPPTITTEDLLEAPVNKLYEVDYNATDIDSPQSKLKWSLFTNATTWLDINYNTGILSGIPGASDVGWYTVNVTVKDQDGGQVWQEFILTVTSEGFDNDPPKITTIDQVSITAGTSYDVIYEATDDRTPLDSLLWSFNSNASWLSFNKITRALSGSPTLFHVGWYWVNVTVNDDEGKFDSHNFTLTVWATANEAPKILTDNDVNAVVDELYSVDYEAEDDHTPIDKLVWSLETNTSEWLEIDPETGVLSGTPKLKDVGSYWVKVSVFDGEDGWDFTNFTLWVTNETLIINHPPQLFNPEFYTSEWDGTTKYFFTIEYYDPDGDEPSLIHFILDDSYNWMDFYNGDRANGKYITSRNLGPGIHNYSFRASDGYVTVQTENFTTPYITESDDDKNGEDKKDRDEDNTMVYTLVGIIILIVILILLFIFLKKKKGKEEEEPVEETHPLPSEKVPPEQIPVEETPPFVQPPTTEEISSEAPPPEQPPIPEIPPEHEPVQEIPPPEQPQVSELTPEQPPPIPVVASQVPQPQIEPSQKEQLPTPQLEEQYQNMPTPKDKSHEPHLNEH